MELTGNRGVRVLWRFFRPTVALPFKLALILIPLFQLGEGALASSVGTNFNPDERLLLPLMLCMTFVLGAEAMDVGKDRRLRDVLSLLWILAGGVCMVLAWLVSGR